MKVQHLIFAAIIFILVSSCTENDEIKTDINSDYYYYFGDEKVPIKLDMYTQNVFIEHVGSESDLRKYLMNHSCGIRSIEDIQLVDHHYDSVLASSSTYYARVRSNCYENFASDEGIYYVGPHFWTRGGGRGRIWHLGLNYDFAARLKDVQDFPLLDSMATLTNTRVAYKRSNLLYKIACSRESAGNSMELANYFYETGLFKWAEPNWTGGFGFADD